jgi:hypothetical protein
MAVGHWWHSLQPFERASFFDFGFPFALDLWQRGRKSFRQHSWCTVKLAACLIVHLALSASHFESKNGFYTPATRELARIGSLVATATAHLNLRLAVLKFFKYDKEAAALRQLLEEKSFETGFFDIHWKQNFFWWLSGWWYTTEHRDLQLSH